jgi:uncharacterized protein (TIGR03083 family)
MTSQIHNVGRLDVIVDGTAQDAASIPPLAHREAASMAKIELERFLALLEKLSDDDWNKPTVCTLWNVRQMVAHVAGAAASYARWSEFKRQNSPRVQRPYRKQGMSELDALNQIQVDDRDNVSPPDLIAELRDVGPRAIRTRYRLPFVLHALRVPIAPLGGWVRIDYLTDLIYTRDMWMHRLDICRATGREMVLTAEHDGRMVALVMRDLARKLSSQLNDATVVYELAGAVGGRWRIGPSPTPAATICMDALDFNLLASGRLALEQARSSIVIEGDNSVADRALERTSVAY